MVRLKIEIKLLKPYLNILELKKMKLDTVTVLKNLFTDPAAGRKFIPDLKAFQSAIYAVAKVAEAFDIDDNLFRYLPFDDVYQLHESTFMNVYLCEGNSALFGDDRMPLSKDLAEVAAKADKGPIVSEGEVSRPVALSYRITQRFGR